VREARRRPTVAEVDLGLCRHNVGLISSLVAPAALCAVVKADAYGHGAIEVARTALESGAQSLAVALIDEGIELAEAGIRAPILILSEPAPSEVIEALVVGLTPTIYTERGLSAAREAAGRLGRSCRVEVKLDTGMHRGGATPELAGELIAEIARSPGVVLGGLWTHLCVADDPSDPFTALQLDRLDALLVDLDRAGIRRPPVVHAANSAGALGHRRARLDLVRCGLACYGYAPSQAVEPVGDGSPGLRPVLRLVSEIGHLSRLAAHERLSYGRAYELLGDATVAVVPIGYADGVPRRLFPGGTVLINGRRRPIAGNVTMDQLIVDCGDDPGVRVGDEVVLLGRQAEEEITAAEWARIAGTITYEVLCGISARVPRHYR